MYSSCLIEQTKDPNTAQFYSSNGTKQSPQKKIKLAADTPQATETTFSENIRYYDVELPYIAVLLEGYTVNLYLQEFCSFSLGNDIVVS